MTEAIDLLLNTSLWAAVLDRDTVDFRVRARFLRTIWGTEPGDRGHYDHGGHDWGWPSIWAHRYGWGWWWLRCAARRWVAGAC